MFTQNLNSVASKNKNIIRAYSTSLRRFILHSLPATRLRWKLKLSRQEFMDYIESLWLYDMSWDTYAVTWDIYHIVPVSFFNHEEKEQVGLCWHHQNLRPMFISDAKMRGACPIVADLILQSTPTKTEIIQKLIEINKPHKDRLLRYCGA